MRWDGTKWVVLTQTKEEIDELMEQMRDDAVIESKEYSEAEIKATRQAIINQLNEELNDVNTNMTTIEKDIDGVRGRVSSAEKTIDKNTNEITSAQSKISSLEVTADDITTQVSDIKSDVTTAQKDITRVEQTAGKIESTVSSVRTDLDELEIGGTNLVPDSERVRNPDSYINYFFDASELLADFEGDTVTLSVYMKTLSGNFDTEVYLYSSHTNSLKKHIFDVDNTWRRYDFSFIVDREIIEYIDRINIKSSNEVETKKLKLERGTKATDWSPAPEDMDARMTATETTIKQLPSEIDLAVKEGVGALEIGGRNLLLDTPNEEVEGKDFSSWNSDVYYITDNAIDELKQGGTYTMSVYYTHTESNNNSRFGLIFQFYTKSSF